MTSDFTTFTQEDKDQNIVQLSLGHSLNEGLGITHVIGMTKRKEDYPTVRQDENMCHVQGRQQTTTIMISKKLTHFLRIPPHYE
jgi:hypothetical protein